MAIEERLGKEQVAPLLALLADRDAGVRSAALRALVRLPLDEGAWQQVGVYVLYMLRAPGAAPLFGQQSAKRQVADALGIDERAVAALPPIARDELIEAALYVPLRPVRRRLRELATASDEDDSWLAALALARVGDRVALPPLLEALEGDDEGRRQIAAYALAGVDVRGAEEQVRRAYAASAFEEGSGGPFWLAIALARAGETGPLAERLASGETGYWGDPIHFDELVASLPPFPEAMRAWLRQQGEEESLPEQGRQLALDLWRAHEPRPAAESITPASREEEEAAERAAQETLAQVGALLAGAEGELSWHLDVEALAAVPAETAPVLVSKLWELALHDRNRFGMGLGNEIGWLVHDLRHAYRPDIRALFATFSSVEDGSLERFQLAWQVSRAGLEEVLAALLPSLQSPEKQERRDAARLVELCALYVGQTYPPVFGGGVAPSAAPPHLDMEETEELAPDLFPPGSFTGAVGRRAGDDEELSFGLRPGRRNGGQRDVAIERVVNTGFAPVAAPASRLDRREALEAGGDYYFWLQIGAPMAESIETTPTALPEVPEKARLTVVLFAFRDGLQVRAGADSGELEVEGPGARVVQQPFAGGGALPESGARLYFPVRVPDEPGSYQLRCSIYWGQLLLQSRLITANAVAPGTAATGAEPQLRSDLDYTISNRLAPAQIKELEPEGMPHRLSLMLNSNGDATHNIHLFGREGDTVVKKGDLRFGEMELADMIENARRKLRRASWGHEEEFQEEWRYRYADSERELQAWREGRPGGEQFIDKLRLDLAAMAKSGYRFYARLVDELLDDDAGAFKKLMRQPATVQIAFRRSVKHLLPAALVYDDRILATADPSQFRLCATFEQALRDGADLLQTPCWQGACPERDAWTVVCPSGFWGFRHFLGMPLTLCDEAASRDGAPCPVPDPPPFIGYSGPLRLAVGAATDLPRWGEHEAGLYGLQPAERWTVIDDINKLFQFFVQPPHVLYFYCHGGLDDGAATLEFGPASPRARIDRTIWSDVHWENPRPLVFINGCHTTAVTPEKAMDLVEPLLRRAHSAGVIGTEVTIFEPLAARFAEACFRRFFAGIPIGQAIRDARVELLQQGNPLGLVYIPFVLAGLRLQAVEVEP
ncbi:MAG: hypothetical protein RRC07_06180 [Anaerolineae bacterium]|nr:hypothetical protein [Anaerolineae bacterium]